MLARTSRPGSLAVLACAAAFVAPPAAAQIVPGTRKVLVSHVGLALTADAPVTGDGWIAFLVPEAGEGATDLNGDGDALDAVVHVHWLQTRVNANLGLAAVPGSLSGDGALLAFSVSERRQADTDLNGDGDATDGVVHVHDLAAGTTSSLGLASSRTRAGEGAVAFVVSEESQGADLNGDGDLRDGVLHVHDAASGSTRNLRAAVREHPAREAIGSGWIAYGLAERDQGRDRNHDGDLEDAIVHVDPLGAGDARNLRRALGPSFDTPSRPAIHDGLVLFGVDERSEQADGNGDGDTDDAVLTVHHLATATTTSIGRSVVGSLTVALGFVVFVEPEEPDGIDLNADGDHRDLILHRYRPAHGLDSTRVAVASFPSASGDDVVFVASERGGGRDLNGDGDAADDVLHTYRPDELAPESELIAVSALRPVDVAGDRALFLADERAQGGRDLDLDGDATDRDVLFLLELPGRRLSNLGIAPAIPESAARPLLATGRIVLRVFESLELEDLNGDGDREDETLVTARVF